MQLRMIKDKKSKKKAKAKAASDSDDEKEDSQKESDDEVILLVGQTTWGVGGKQSVLPFH